MPILFTSETVAAVSCIVKNREIGGVCQNNKFVLKRQYQGSVNHLDGWQMVKIVASRASLYKPELMTSTRIRKELATVGHERRRVDIGVKSFGPFRKYP